jgi:hypothetical protein
MNCNPEPGIPRAAPRALGALVALQLVALPACGVPASDAAANEGSAELIYSIDYHVTPDPGARGAHVVMAVNQPGDYLREVDMPLRGGEISDVKGEGNLSLRDDRVVWNPPAAGGSLQWFATIDNRRNGDTYDAYIADDWALFRGEDIIPSANTRTLQGATSRTSLSFNLPAGWSSVTQYFGRQNTYAIDNPHRRFDTPTGWIVLGRIGVRRETIANVVTRVAGPTGHSIRRMDILALLRWTLPEVLLLLPEFPERLTFVSAGAPMWRGALSAPQSVYVHADRPLISENGTSTILHETIHVGLGLTAAQGADWIVEGFAEYYSLEVLLRSGTISNERYKSAHAGLASWGREARELCTPRSSGSNTARAVALLADLNGEIRKASGGEANLDDVLFELGRYEKKITVEGFREIVEGIAGKPVDTLRPKNLPGCT